MRIAGIIARILLGLLFTVFGLNGFLHFLHMPPPPPAAMPYFAGMASAHLLLPAVFGVQLVCGILFLTGFFVPLALVLIGPIIANILLFHLSLEPAGIGPGLLALILWLVVFYSLREHFRGIFTARS